MVHFARELGLTRFKTIENGSFFLFFPSFPFHYRAFGPTARVESVTLFLNHPLIPSSGGRYHAKQK
jgi:hypothetical protein